MFAPDTMEKLERMAQLWGKVDDLDDIENAEEAEAMHNHLARELTPLLFPIVEKLVKSHLLLFLIDHPILGDGLLVGDHGGATVKDDNQICISVHTGYLKDKSYM